VAYLIGGSVRMESDDRVRVSAELVAVAPNVQWWAQTLSYAQQDSRVETMIARDIAIGAISSIPDKEWEWGTKRLFENQTAWEYYVKAESLWLSWPGPTYRQEIIQNFERALQLEPEFAYTLAGLLGNYIQLAAERLGPVDTIEPAQVLFARLEKLATVPGDEDRMRRSAAVMRARHAYQQFDFDAASRLAETVLSEDPNNTGAQTLLAAFELHRGDTDEALRKFQRSVSAGALIPPVLNTVASLQLAAGRSGSAVDYVDEMLPYVRADYTRGRLLLTKAEAQLAQGDTGAALKVIGESERLLAETHPAAIAALLVNTGDTERARNLLSQADQGKITDAATLIDLVRGYLALGEFEAAARLADEAIRARHVPTIGWLRASIGTFGVADEPSWMSIRQALEALPAPTRIDTRNPR
jgi:tetratricopeptide (TPR) repeat protein